ncbi:hypothetical protein ACFWBF_30245 [Streptomyces sp. NPDC060028]|uniref:hypothetical protein n=1 Tax=Streptomyces sp. NPDC060028 TaxID=3347041 RepID=UPI0036BE1C5F
MKTARQHHTRTVRRRLLAAAAVTLTIAAFTAGCTKDNESAPPAPSPTVSPSPTADPQAAEKTALLGVYRAYWDAQLKVYASGSTKDTGIEKVAGDKAYSKVQSTRAYYVDNHLVVKGAPVLAPKVSTMDVTSVPPSATITDCVDSTNYITVEQDTGKPVQTIDSNRRHAATYAALKIGGTWQIRDSDISRDSTC